MGSRSDEYVTEATGQSGQSYENDNRVLDLQLKTNLDRSLGLFCDLGGKRAGVNERTQDTICK